LHNCSIFVTRSPQIIGTLWLGEAACLLRISEPSFHVKSSQLLIMNRSSSNENVLSNHSALRHKPRKVGLRQRPKPAKVSVMEVLPAEPQLPGIGTMARTRRLILAAVRVWELNRGIRDR
jgi:hypothetical protein